MSPNASKGFSATLVVCLILGWLLNGCRVPEHDPLTFLIPVQRNRNTLDLNHRAAGANLSGEMGNVPIN